MDTIGDTEVKIDRECLQEAWAATLKTFSKRGLGAEAMVVLEALARDDVDQSMEMLEGSTRQALARWYEWYPHWTRTEATRLLDERPWLSLTAEARRERRKAHTRERVAAAKERGILDRARSALAAGPLPISQLAVAVFGARNATQERREKLAKVLGESGEFGIVRTFAEPWTTWRWRREAGADLNAWRTIVTKKPSTDRAEGCA